MSTETKIVALKQTKKVAPSKDNNNNNSALAVPLPSQANNDNKNSDEGQSEAESTSGNGTSTASTATKTPLELLIDKAKILNRTRARHNLYDSPDFGKPTTVMRYLHEESYISPFSNLHDYAFGLDLIDSIRTNFPFVYRINDGVSTNIILQAVCQERGWKEFSADTPEFKALSYRDKEYFEETNWNLWWSYNFYHGRPYRSLKCWQFTNHNPRSFQICSKIYLSCFIRKMSNEHGGIYDFIPRSFVLPAEYIPFVTEHSRRQAFGSEDHHNIIIRNSGDSFEKYGLQSTPQITNGQAPGIRTIPSTIRTPVWITKPPARSQGKGIYLFTDLCDIPSTSGGTAKAVVQEYITNPYLIGGYKWDMRIYVCIVSVDPLIIYMYREGLVRFATEKYDMSQLTSSFSHLTNSSLNKLAPEYMTDKEVIGPGCKWSFKQLRAYFKSKGINDWLMWQRIMSIVVLTVVGESLNGGFSWPINRNCFDFLGFDILIDEEMRPFLLEVNYSPGLGGDCEVDDIVKKPMLHELFDLLGMPNCSNGVDEYSKAETIRTKEIVKERLAKWTKASCEPSSSSTRSNNIFAKSMIDCTSKGRLKDARAIYSQDIIAPYLNNFANMPKAKMSAALKTLLRRRKLQEEQMKFNSVLKHQKAILQEALLDEQRSNNQEKAQTDSSLELLAIECDRNHIVSEFVHDDESTTATGTENSNKSSCVSTAEHSPVRGAASSAKPHVIKDLRKGSAIGTNKPGSAINPETAFIRPATMDTGVKKDSEEDTKQYVFIKRPDWTNPPKSSGDWVLVYPNQCTTNYRSPYKNPIAELRAAIENMEHFIRVSRGLVHSFQNHSDDSYRRKLKSMLTRWDAEVWVPAINPPNAAINNKTPGTSTDVSDCELELKKGKVVKSSSSRPPSRPTSAKSKLMRKYKHL